MLSTHNSGQSIALQPGTSALHFPALNVVFPHPSFALPSPRPSSPRLPCPATLRPAFLALRLLAHPVHPPLSPDLWLPWCCCVLSNDHIVWLCVMLAGTSCNKDEGFCDYFQSCRVINQLGPLARLKSLLLSFTSVEELQNWLKVCSQLGGSSTAPYQSPQLLIISALLSRFIGGLFYCQLSVSLSSWLSLSSSEPCSLRAPTQKRNPTGNSPNLSPNRSR